MLPPITLINGVHSSNMGRVLEAFVIKIIEIYDSPHFSHECHHVVLFCSFFVCFHFVLFLWFLLSFLIFWMQSLHFLNSSIPKFETKNWFFVGFACTIFFTRFIQHFSHWSQKLCFIRQVLFCTSTTRRILGGWQLQSLKKIFNSLIWINSSPAKTYLWWEKYKT